MSNKEWNQNASRILRQSYQRTMTDPEADDSIQWLAKCIEDVTRGGRNHKGSWEISHGSLGDTR